MTTKWLPIETATTNNIILLLADFLIDGRLAEIWVGRRKTVNDRAIFTPVNGVFTAAVFHPPTHWMPIPEFEEIKNDDEKYCEWNEFSNKEVTTLNEKIHKTTCNAEYYFGEIPDFFAYCPMCGKEIK